MPGLQPKKMLILNILEILKKYTDIEHPMTQKQIIDCLERDYGMTADRKAVRRNLSRLMETGYPVCIKSEKQRSFTDAETGETETTDVCSDIYYEHEFDDSELRLLIDGLLFSRHIPYSQCKTLVEKLEGLSNERFRSHMKHVSALPDNMPDNRQLFYTIGILDDAISAGKQVELTYCGYGTDKKLHPHLDAGGNPRRLTVNPYQIAAVNGRYYLICNQDRYDDVANYRVDRIADIVLKDTPVKPKREVKGLKNGLDLPKHMAEHLYMFPGESVSVLFRAKRYLLNDIIDWFGRDITFENETEETVDVRVRVNRTAMAMWAMQYALHTEILEPADLREEIKEDLRKAMKQYAGME